MSAPVAPPPPAFGRFFLPGPTDVHPEVLAAMQRPMIGHRSGAMEQLLAALEARLARRLGPARPCSAVPPSATGFRGWRLRTAGGTARRRLATGRSGGRLPRR